MAREPLRALLEDEPVPKRVHDLEGHVLRSLGAAGRSACAACDDDLMLYSYLINPTHATHRLSDVAARFSGRPLQETGEALLPEAAHAIRSARRRCCATTWMTLDARAGLRGDRSAAGPVLLRMEDGRRAHRFRRAEPHGATR